MEVQQHFMPVFSGLDGEVVRDCKLSHLAYGLVLMNSDRNVAVVGQFQVSVLENFLGDIG